MWPIVHEALKGSGASPLSHCCNFDITMLLWGMEKPNKILRKLKKYMTINIGELVSVNLSSQPLRTLICRTSCTVLPNLAVIQEFTRSFA